MSIHKGQRYKYIYGNAIDYILEMNDDVFGAIINSKFKPHIGDVYRFSGMIKTYTDSYKILPGQEKEE